MFFVRAKNLPDEITSYDLLKSLAVILMVVDHVGSYLLPEQQLWRVLASSAPLWFFFVGYAANRNLTSPIWIGAGILVVAEIIFGGKIFALSILASIIVMRLIIDPIMSRCKTPSALIFVFVASVLLWLPSRMVFEYGTMGLLLTMVGYILRHSEHDAFLKRVMAPFVFAALIFFALTHMMSFVMSPFEFYGFITTTLIIFGLMILFRPKTYPKLSSYLPDFIANSLKIMGRYSLYLYVAHVVLFMAIGLKMNPERFSLFQVELF